MKLTNSTAVINYASSGHNTQPQTEWYDRTSKDLKKALVVTTHVYVDITQHDCMRIMTTSFNKK